MTHLEAKARIFLSQRPLLYPLIQTLRGRTSGEYCDGSTDLCIEGFESSANTFVHSAFRVLDEDLSMAHHKHVVANLKRALRYDVPTLIMYRDPAEAIPSLVARFRPGIEEAPLRYVHFYRFVIEHADRFMLVSFEEATSDIGAVVTRVSEAWGFQFPSFDPHELERLAKKRIKEWTEKYGHLNQISLPREEREQVKKDIRARLPETEAFPEARGVYAQLQDIRQQAH
jgi:hypothetical protein